jgi:hypothetical protein
MKLESLNILKEILIIIINFICVVIVKLSKDYLEENDEGEND